MRTERWQNSDTGQWYEVEFEDGTPTLADIAATQAQLPAPADEPSEPPWAIPDRPRASAVALRPPPPEPINPRKARLLARLMRAVLEGPKDAA